MKVKTSELTGIALDWAVAAANGYRRCMPADLTIDALSDLIYETEGWADENGFDRWSAIIIDGRLWQPSTDWSQGGPIIEREEIGTRRNAPCSKGREWEAGPSITAKGAGGKYGYGPTPLIAAMRCYVASKLGDEVEIPEELLK